MTVFVVVKLRMCWCSETSEGYWSFRYLGLEMEYEIQTRQVQHDAAGEQTDK